MLNRKKSVEIVITAPRSRRKIVIPSVTIPGLEELYCCRCWVWWSITNYHVEDLLTKCSWTQFAPKTLRSHCMPDIALQNVFQAAVLAKLSYASSAWWGQTNACDRECIEVFLKHSAGQDFQFHSHYFLIYVKLLITIVISSTVCCHENDAIITLCIIGHTISNCPSRQLRAKTFLILGCLIKTTAIINNVF